jgi:hypothetical protein
MSRRSARQENAHVRFSTRPKMRDSRLLCVVMVICQVWLSLFYIAVHTNLCTAPKSGVGCSRRFTSCSWRAGTIARSPLFLPHNINTRLTCTTTTSFLPNPINMCSLPLFFLLFLIPQLCPRTRCLFCPHCCNPSSTTSCSRHPAEKPLFSSPSPFTLSFFNPTSQHNGLSLQYSPIRKAAAGSPHRSAEYLRAEQRPLLHL